MEVIEVLDRAIEVIWPYWSALVVGAIFFMLDRLLTVMVWKNPRLPKTKWRTIGRRTRQFHTLLIAIFVGLIPGIPVPPSVDTRAGAVLYFMGAAILGGWLFPAADKEAEECGYDLAVRGVDSFRPKKEPEAPGGPPAPPNHE